MVRFRSAAAPTAASPAPRQARYFVCTLLLSALAATAGCSAAAVRGEPSSLGSRAPTIVDTSTTEGDPSVTGPTVTSSSTQSLTALKLAAETAWASSKTAFYKAALLGDPQYAPLLDTLVPGGPVELHSIAYLSGLVTEGVRGPPTWHVGDGRVVSVTVTRARVDGCLYDTGSVWKSTGTPAPASLGGGAGLTASDATLVFEGGRWLVLDDDVSAVSSPKERGPCHGF